MPCAAPAAENDDLNEEEGLLLRAADLIGQLGDPNYMRKSNALFHEFEEIGLNEKPGYATPADIIYKIPAVLFYQRRATDPACDSLSQRDLQGSPMDREPTRQLFRAEREVNLSGPQR
jgi:hypothetical protein